MTIVLILLGLILLVAFALGVELLRLSCLAPETLNSGLLDQSFPDPVSYRPLVRLASEEDCRYISQRGLSVKAARRFRRSRAKIAAAYLREMRRDFHRAWSICRVLAPFSDDPEFGTRLLRQFLLFHGLYFALHVRFALGVNLLVELDVSRLVESLSELQAAAQRTLQTSNPFALQGASS
jgi:hypothetical protein